MISLSNSEYYILKCPVCDVDITKVIEQPSREVICPNCKRVLDLYSIFGYNMWLSEIGKTTKVNKKPIKDVVYDETDIEYDSDDYEYDEETIIEDYLNNSHLFQKRPEALHKLLLFNANTCLMQLKYLMKVGFTRKESIEIIKKLIEQSFLL